ncbi:galactose-1-phosphate uridylyltransferase [bacterium]|nr:galactose-1-phosphate uridylyltransferase [bacterium]
MPSLRKNIITGEWVIIAPERAKRPEDYIRKKPKKKKTKDCPFCIPGPAYPTRVYETKNIYVIPNKYPSYIPEDAVLERGGKLYPAYRALGYHEVVNLKKHRPDLSGLSLAVLDELFYVYQERMKKHLQDPAVEYSLLIHNHGESSGASIEHPHSQIFSSSVLPSRIRKELKGAQRYFQKEKRCVFCSLVAEELRKGERVILENKDFVAFTFFAARFPFEIWILPKKHRNYFEKMNKSKRVSLAEIFSSVLKILDKKLGDPDFNFFIHTTPAKEAGAENYYHWHIEILPRLSKFGGYELGGGIVVDVVSPEKAAWFLRQD